MTRRDECVLLVLGAAAMLAGPAAAGTVPADGVATVPTTAFRYSPSGDASSAASTAASAIAASTMASTRPVRDDEWWVNPSAAIWLPGVRGTIGARGRTTEVNALFLDVLQNSDSVLGLTGTIDAGYGRLGGYFSGSWMRVGVDIGPDSRDSIVSTITLLGFGASYDLLRVPMSYTATHEHAARHLVLQLRAGARFTKVDVELNSVDLGKRSQDKDWIDPMVGFRLSVPISQDFSFVLPFEVGGFGAASDFAWAVGPMLSWDFHIGTLPSSLQFGYLWVGDDYAKGSGDERFVWDTELHGPVVNFVVRF